VPADSSDEWTHAEQKALLNAGVSPIADFAGTTSVVRSITTHSLSGTDPDYRCLDTANVSVSQYVRDEVKALALTEAESNHGVGPDLPDGLPQIEGVSTPRIWGATIQARLEEIEAVGWIRDVAGKPPIVAYNEVTDANESIVPVVVRPHQHQIFASIRQVVA
jgi:phage tail sheath gpL-like